MQEPIRITFRGIGHSDAIEQRIRAKSAQLERFHDRITSCHVTVDVLHNNHHKGNLYCVRVNLLLPDTEIVAGHGRPQDHTHEDVYVAIRDAFDATVRQLEDHTQRRRDKVKRAASRATP